MVASRLAARLEVGKYYHHFCPEHLWFFEHDFLLETFLTSPPERSKIKDNNRTNTAEDVESNRTCGFCAEANGSSTPYANAVAREGKRQDGRPRKNAPKTKAEIVHEIVTQMSRKQTYNNHRSVKNADEMP